MTHEELQEFEPERDEDFDDEHDDADDWDEEALGLDWNEADEQNVVRDVVPGRWAD